MKQVGVPEEGPMSPAALAESNARWSPSMKTTMSPLLSQMPFHITEPLPESGMSATGPADEKPTTRAPALAARSAVPSAESWSTTSTSSTAPAATRSSTTGATTPSMVEAQLRAGTTTDTRTGAPPGAVRARLASASCRGLPVPDAGRS